MFERGQIRIAAASSYADPSLNPAIHDDELRITGISLASEVTMTVVDKATGAPKGKITPRGNLTSIVKSDTDFYVYCVSCVCDLRLFDDPAQEAPGRLTPLPFMTTAAPP